MLNRRIIAIAAPYAVWMALQFALPPVAWAYAVRSAAALTALIAAWIVFGGSLRSVLSWRVVGWGCLCGLAVLALWVLPEYSAFYRRVFTYAAPAEGSSPYDPAVCGWPLACARLFGSAFVIAPAEELFFRFFLYRRLQSSEWESVDGGRFDRSAFLWTVALFALEHDRWLAGALAGSLYGLLALRISVSSAIVAHVITNLLLGVFVMQSGAWSFW